MRVSRTAPNAPIPAASVGAAQPSTIEPSTANIIARGGTSATTVIRTFCANRGSSAWRGRRGATLGSMVHRTRM